MSLQHTVSSEAEQLARVLWEYQRLNAKLEPAEVIIAMGCEDERVAERAARLYKDGFGKWVICTGRSGTRTKAILQAKGFPTEAAYFAAILQKAGVPAERILQEDRSTNSGENIAYTKELLARNGIKAEAIIVVTAPYAERRQQAVYAAQWPEQKVVITSPELTYEEYSTTELTEGYLINALVGRVQRMKVYADRGFQAKVEVPGEVWTACERLIEMGFTEQLVQK